MTPQGSRPRSPEYRTFGQRGSRTAWDLPMSLNVDYESDPPPGVDTEDSTWVVGAGFEF